jgi:hypothetical protein
MFRFFGLSGGVRIGRRKEWCAEKPTKNSE